MELLNFGISTKIFIDIQVCKDKYKQVEIVSNVHFISVTKPIKSEHNSS